jgi:glycosyltransferase involved in cell wall biosynthesis
MTAVDDLPVERAQLRVLHVTDSYLPTVGGIELHIADLADRQHHAGHEVDILTRGSGTSLGDCLLHVVRPETEAWQAPRTVRLGQILSPDTGYDVVHAHASVYSPLAWRATLICTRRRIPVVFTGHSLLNGVLQPYRTASRLLRLRHLPVVWSGVSTTAARSLRAGFAFGPDAVRVLPNAVDPTVWRPDGVHVEHDVVTFVAVMRLARRKRPLALLRAFERAGVSGSARLVVVGDGPQAEACRRWCRTHPTVDVVLRGPQDREEIRDILRQGDVFVAPATRESFGIAALEARESGLPVIARSGNGIADFVEHDVHGQLVDSDAELAETIRALTCDRPFLRKLTARTHEHSSGYDWANATSAAEVAYRDAAAVSARVR